MGVVVLQIMMCKMQAGEDDGELQDRGHSKRRQLAEGDGESRPLRPPPIARGAQVPSATSAPVGIKSRDENDEEEGRAPRVRLDAEKPTSLERYTLPIPLMVQTLHARPRSLEASSQEVRRRPGVQ